MLRTMRLASEAGTVPISTKRCALALWVLMSAKQPPDCAGVPFPHGPAWNGAQQAQHRRGPITCDYDL